MSAFALALALFVFVLVVYAVTRARRVADDELERKRLEAIDERRTSAYLYAHEHPLEVAPRHPPGR